MPKKKIISDKKSRISFITFIQSIYLTIKSFVSNDLISYASACTFGFLYSLFPILMMIVIVLVRVMHTTPEAVTLFLQNNFDIPSFFNLQGIISSALTVNGITIFEIVLGFSIIMMARRFFASLSAGLNKIFGEETKSSSLIRQLIIFAGEALLIVLVSVTIFILVSSHTLANTPHLNMILDKFPLLSKIVNSLAKKFISIGLLFIAVSVCYKFGSRTKPKFIMCLIMAAGTTVVFNLFLKLMHFFINVTKYNFVFGVLSSTFVILMEVFFFFLIFLFFAQWLFVYQFFDTLLICELYLLPSGEDYKFYSNLKRMLFIRPDFFLHQDEGLLKIKSGEAVYETNESDNGIYYIYKGTIQLIESTHAKTIEKGSLFGIETCFINEPRNETAVALTNCQLIKIAPEIFLQVLEKNQKASIKALTQVRTYFTKFYKNSRIQDTISDEDADEETDEE